MKAPTDWQLKPASTNRLCEQRLREALLIGSQVKKEDGNPLFAFNLHQCISQGGSVYATLERPQDRLPTLGGQLYGPGEQERFLYPLVLCGIRGQEYDVVDVYEESHRLFPGFTAIAQLNEEDQDEGQIKSGYFLPGAEGTKGFDDTVLPDHWLDNNGRVARNYRPRVPRRLFVTPNGIVKDSGGGNALQRWFLKEPLILCLCCGEAYTRRDQDDFGKLSKLSGEGRSTSMTLLSVSSISALRTSETDPGSHKILSFTDNRQDSSLQAGHLNDSVHVALLRPALVIISAPESGKPIV